MERRICYITLVHNRSHSIFLTFVRSVLCNGDTFVLAGQNFGDTKQKRNQQNHQQLCNRQRSNDMHVFYMVAYPMKANAGSSSRSNGITKSKLVLNRAVMVSIMQN